jgi:hypothetical protein
MFFHRPSPSIRCGNFMNMGNTKFFFHLYHPVSGSKHSPLPLSGGQRPEYRNWRHYKLFSLTLSSRTDFP